MKYYRIEINGAYCGEWIDEYIMTPYENIHHLADFIEELCDEWSNEWWDEQGQEDYDNDQCEYRADFIWNYFEVAKEQFPKDCYYYVSEEGNKYIGEGE